MYDHPISTYMRIFKTKMRCELGTRELAKKILISIIHLAAQPGWSQSEVNTIL